jgi:hypothetical protein
MCWGRLGEPFPAARGLLGQSLGRQLSTGETRGLSTLHDGRTTTLRPSSHLNSYCEWSY